MHTRIQLKITSVALALLGLLPFCAPTRAAMPMNDTFTDGGRTNGADLSDGAWWAMAATTLSVVDDSAGLGGGNALEITPPATGSRGVVANLPAPVSLQDGDILTLSFRWRFTGTTALNQSQRLRFGVYNSGGTRTLADNTESIRYDDRGYYGVTNPGAVGSGTGLYREPPGNDDVTGGSNQVGIGTAGASISAGTTAHSAEITLSRTGGTLGISVSIDGLAPSTATETSPIAFTYDCIAITLGGGSLPSPLRIDDVQVEYYHWTVNDGFTDGTRTNGSDSLDANWLTLGNPAVAVVNDGAGIGYGNALQLTPTSTGRGLVAGFASRTLADGDSLTLSFNWRFTGTTALNQSKNLRFGLHSANGTPATADNTTETDNDKGYFVGTNPGAAGAGGTILHRESGSSGILGGGDWITLGAAGTSINAGTTPHFATLTITRVGSTLQVSSSIDNQPAATGTDSSPVTYTFDQLALSLAGATLPSPLIIDNVQVDYYSPDKQTIGGGTIGNPAIGPAPSYGLGGTGYTLVKNWDFGANGTIKTITDLSTHFQYHDNHGLIANPNYGSYMVSPDDANKIGTQPVEGVNTASPVREVFADSMKTYVVPLNGATTISSSPITAGSGSFAAKWTLPNGGSLLNQDIVWETRVRYVTPRYFWFSIWADGNKWTAGGGAEMDLIESYGYDHGGTSTNFDGRYWHSSPVGGTKTTNYNTFSWGYWMGQRGITSYDATQWHIWTWVYKKDNTYVAYVDGIPVQDGTIIWTNGSTAGGEAINMFFHFDALWGSPTLLAGKTIPASELIGKYYEWDYSRVYLRN